MIQADDGQRAAERHCTNQSDRYRNSQAGQVNKKPREEHDREESPR